MRPNSLAFRLFASAAAWTLVVLPVTAFLLLSLYRQAVERSFDARLNVYLTSLIASTTAEGASTPKAPANLGEPVFTIPFSGWYWQIKPLEGAAERPLFVSDSLLDQQLKLPSQEGVTPDQHLIRRAYAPARKISACASSSARSSLPERNRHPIPMRSQAMRLRSTRILPNSA